ncbi:DUF4331 domain-containing protein [soil metagenome]
MAGENSSQPPGVMFRLVPTVTYPNRKALSMKRPQIGKTRLYAMAGLSGALVLSLLVSASASSHREAPLITEDPVADNTDVYAFVSPDKPDTVTLISNWVPLEEPAGGPNFQKFGDEVLYEINIDNNGDAVDDITYEFRFSTEIGNPDTFLYNTGPITSLDDPDFNIRQFYTVTEVRDGVRTELGSHLPTPPVNIGPRSTPDYAMLAREGIQDLGGGMKVFAGQRDDAFFVDLGSVFDLLGLRPLNPAHVIPLPAADGRDNVSGYNTHSIAIQVPMASIVEDDPVIGVYSTTYRRQSRVFRPDGGNLVHRGPWVQVSRLGNPLINEVIIPLRDKDNFNASEPADDAQFLPYVLDPEPGRLIPALYPVFECFPDAPRDDLVSVFLTGIPGINQPQGVVPSEMLRLNTSIPTGFPNGRTLTDDVVDTELVALAGAALPAQECFGQEPNSSLTDGVDQDDDDRLLNRFPYIGTPHQGYESDENESVPDQ